MKKLKLREVKEFDPGQVGRDHMRTKGQCFHIGSKQNQGPKEDEALEKTVNSWFLSSVAQ